MLTGENVSFLTPSSFSHILSKNQHALASLTAQMTDVIENNTETAGIQQTKFSHESSLSHRHSDVGGLFAFHQFEEGLHCVLFTLTFKPLWSQILQSSLKLLKRDDPGCLLSAQGRVHRQHKTTKFLFNFYNFCH